MLSSAANVPPNVFTSAFKVLLKKPGFTVAQPVDEGLTTEQDEKLANAGTPRADAPTMTAKTSDREPVERDRARVLHTCDEPPIKRIFDGTTT